MSKEYRVSDVSIDSVKSTQTKEFLREKLLALQADGWVKEDILQAGDTWFIVCSREMPPA